MAILKGKSATVYAVSGSSVAMTNEPCTSLGDGTYQITNSAKRILDPDSNLTTSGSGFVLDRSYGVDGFDHLLGKVADLDRTPGLTVTVSGSYVSLAEVAQLFEWSIEVKAESQDVSTFGDVWKKRVPLTVDWSGKAQGFWASEYWFNLASNVRRFMVKLYLDRLGGSGFWGLCSVDWGLAVPSGKIVQEEITLHGHGPLTYSASL